MLNSYTFFAKIVLNSSASVLLLYLKHKLNILSIITAFGLVLTHIPILLISIPSSTSYFKSLKHKLFITLTLIIEYSLFFSFYKFFDRCKLVNYVMMIHFVLSAFISCLHYFLCENNLIK